ncbi:tumor necrosis factor ligand superfamily member 10 isoform X3 [Bos indicus]|uniref:Tumor necrosis factor ligand superfamily member 10 isoform X3 n=1 Tax=Bos indicus TaxID=9915 RepID=A0ABM4SJN0_BOSIN|nr:tumor necrosis factor ligand superfamily member 10 isoform X3 [Bos taurus]XP_027396745.1 tumor necrosis factor ligand superfamily member 10 isoform X4 [Bos indicus x Bos taurus]XP_061271662.1 tumor necrosis factor ligand superfamily member 10 isoform X4 [Bos javanicus]
MALKQAPGSRLGQICMPILIFTVLLQAFGMAVFYMYFNKELKQFAETDCQRLMAGQQRGSGLAS